MSGCAVVIVDMQNDFCSQGGAMSELRFSVEANERVLAALPGFVDDMRHLGSHIVWVRQISAPAFVSKARMHRASMMGRSPTTVCLAGSWGAELADGLLPDKEDLIIEKTRYSAFFGTPLDVSLRSRAIDEVVVCGTAANVCVDATVRDAYMRDYSVTLAEDLVGWTRGDLAAASIENLRLYYCDVRDSAAIASATQQLSV